MQHAPARVKPLLRGLPLLFHASFAFPGIKENAPGMAGFRKLRNLGLLAQNLSLPPPLAGARGEQRVEALFGSIAGERFTLWVLPRAGLDAEQRNYVQERFKGVEGWIRHHRLPIDVKLLSPNIALASEPWPELVSYGALLAGRPPAGFWGSAPAGVGIPLKGPSQWRWTEAAPTPKSQLLALLLHGKTLHGPGSALSRELQRSKARDLADPEVFLSRWTAADVEGIAASLSQLELARRDATPAEILKAGREVALLGLRKVRHWPKADRERAMPIVRRLVLGAEIPRPFLPMLAAALESQQNRLGKTRWTMSERKIGKIRELRDASGGRLGRGSTASQARVRALAVLSLALGRSPMPVTRGWAWQRIGERLASPVEQRTMVVLVHAERVQGDLGMSLSRGLLVLLRPGYRPSSFRLPGKTLLGRLLKEQQRGAFLEILPASPEAGPQVRRLQHLTDRMTESRRQGIPLAIEYGEHIWWADRNRVRCFSRARFAVRPRRCLFVPSGPDWRPNGRPWPSLVQCSATVLSNGYAWLRYEDAQQWQLTERVPLGELEAYLNETIGLLRDDPQPTWLAVRAGEDLELAIRRNGTFRGSTLKVKAKVTLPYSVSVQVGAGPEELKTDSAAELILSEWPVGQVGRVSLKDLQLTTKEGTAPGLLKLYARSLVLRRLGARMQHRRTPRGD